MKNSNNADLIDGVFRKMGLRGKIKLEKFWQKTMHEIGQEAEDLYICIQNRNMGTSVDPYPLKNKNLALANAVASQYDSARIKAFVAWFLDENIPLSGEVLDIGCDNGILTCALASILPHVKFVGIDPCSEAIILAQKRASQLGLSNVNFIASNVENYASENNKSRFSCVLTVTVVHELIANGMIEEDRGIMTMPNPDFCLFDNNAKFISTSTEVPLLKNISSLLNPSGILISLDRWGISGQLLRWVRLAEEHQFSLDLNRSTVIEFESDEKEFMPVTVFHSGQRGNAETCDVLALAGLGRFPSKGLLHVTDCNAAELIYNGLNRSELLVKEIVYLNGSGTMRVHIGVAQGLGYIYKTTSRAFRELHLFPSLCLREYFYKLEIDQKELSAAADISVRISDVTIAERLQIDISGYNAGNT